MAKTESAPFSVALVTGASRGIGAAIARGLASQGYAVAVNCSSEASMTAARELAAELSGMGVEAAAFKADVSDFDQAQGLVAEVMQKWGRLDVLVNNAGITRDGLLLRMSEEAFDSVIAVNLKGAFNCLRHAAPVMMRQRCGSIVNLSSVVGLHGNAGQANYAASKAGIVGLTRSAAKELAPRGIRVNAVAPGFIDTDMTRQMSEKARQAAAERIGLGHLGAPEDVAEAVCFLAGEKARYITGQVLAIDGGLQL